MQSATHIKKPYAVHVIRFADGNTVDKERAESVESLATELNGFTVEQLCIDGESSLIFITVTQRIKCGRFVFAVIRVFYFFFAQQIGVYAAGHVGGKPIAVRTTELPVSV